MNPNDYDEDGNNIVPCPICMSNYNPCKNGGKCPEEDDFVRSMEANQFIKSQQELAGEVDRIKAVIRTFEVYDDEPDNCRRLLSELNYALTHPTKQTENNKKINK